MCVWGCIIELSNISTHNWLNSLQGSDSTMSKIYKYFWIFGKEKKLFVTKNRSVTNVLVLATLTWGLLHRRKKIGH